jgi:BirA family biotin operon repressor/biotin-[acetyl-CoA-carboxylase] ligase
MNRTVRPLDAATLRDALVGPWAQLDVVERTGSTNADLMAAAMDGAPDRSVLVADYQEAGRGRLTRNWVAPPGSGIAVSVLLRPEGVPPSRFGWLPLLAGLAVLDTVRACTDAPSGLKWPNDLLLGTERRKVAGILAEVADPVRPAVVVGIGLNVSAAPPDQPGATSLAEEGADVGVELPGGATYTGIAEDVDSDGRLLLLDPAGHRRAVAAGDVVHLRPAE